MLTGDNFHFPAGKFWKTPFVKVITINISLQSVSREPFARSGSYNQPLPHRTSTNQVATVEPLRKQDTRNENFLAWLVSIEGEHRFDVRVWLPDLQLANLQSKNSFQSI